MPIHERGDRGAKRTGRATPVKRAARRTGAPSKAPSLLRPEDVIELQRDAGNRAVTSLVQRELESGSLAATHAREPIPQGGPDIRPPLQAKYPALLGALTADQLAQWQRVVDHYTILWDVDFRLRRLWDDFSYYGEVRAQHPDYLAERRRLVRAVPPKPDERLSVDVRLLLADDVREPPEWDVRAETDFRQWAVEQITKRPLELSTRPVPGEALGQHPMPGIVHKTKGFVTAEDLRTNYADEYARRVSKREELVKLQEALQETTDVWLELQPMHAERSAINAKRIGFGAVRHISEALGEGSQAYPSLRIWDQPYQLMRQAWPLLRERKYELAVPLIAMAEQLTADAARRFSTYENRVMTGAGTAVKWLNRLKTAGTVAAGIASGGLGLTGSALVAGGYSFTQEGLGRAAEMHYGQRTNLGLASLVQAAGVSAVMTYLGGALQSRFQVAIKARIDQIPNLAGTKLAELTSSAMAAGTSSVYMTATETALKAIVEGKALPKSATEFADLIVDNAVQSVAMEVGLSGVNSRVAKEYEAWRSGSRGPAVTVPEATGTGATGRVPPAIDAPGTAAGGKNGRLSDVAVRSLLTEAGGWQRLHAELHGGTGLGANMAVAERQALISRFEAHREGLARNAGAVFGGTLVVVDSATGRQVEVHFTGPEAAQRVQHADEYLDARSPGWERQTEVRLVADPASTRSPRATTGGPGDRDPGHVADQLGPDAQVLAAELVPLYTRYRTMSPEARFDAVLAIANRHLAASGAPPLIPNHLDNPTPRDLGMQAAASGELHINRALVSQKDPTPEQFAEVCDTIAHEARHALQWFRMVRLHLERTMPAATWHQVRARAETDPVLRRFAPQTVKAAWEAQTGARAAESFQPGQVPHDAAGAIYESVFSPAGAASRRRIYDRLDDRANELGTALDRLTVIEQMSLPENDRRLIDARDRYQEALAADRRAQRDYEMLIEEIDARTHGNDVAQAVLRDVRMLPQVRDRARDAYRAFFEADRATRNPARTGRDARAAARTEAFRRYEEAMRVLRRVQLRIEAAAARAAAVQGGGSKGSP